MQPDSCKGIYEIAHAFRDDLTGKNHLREFTMVEWYRKHYHYLDLVNDIVEMMKLLAEIDSAEFGKNPNKINILEYQIISVADLFQKYFQVRIEPGWGYREYLDLAINLKFISSKTTKSESGMGHLLSEVFTLLYDYCVVNFGRSFHGIFFIRDYPDFLRGMAKLSEEGWAMRIEAYLNNLELCSGYQELDNAEELEKIWEYNNQIRKFSGKHIHNVDTGIIKTAEYMKGVSGMAMGLERTLMSLYNIQNIQEFVL